jgi:cobalt-zinc-cadmium efflux system membrane fusion protein
MKMGEPDDQVGQRSGRSILRPGMILVLILIAACFGAGAYRIVGLPLGSPTRAQTTTDRLPHLTREGGRITVPQGSPLRNKLTVDAVGEKEIQRTLMLPAAVEADPGRLVKVLPPLAGRITQLKVQLGERVDIGQPLIVLDSPDLATAQAEHVRAKALLALALKNRDRQRDLTRIGGGALKDQLQAEADYLTAEVELQRTDARLRQIGVNPDTPHDSRTVTITAPIAGSVIELAAAPGAFWNDLNAVLMTVADLSTVWVTANVPEKDTAFVAKGQAVDVVFGAYPSDVFKGEVLFVSDILDADTRRTKVRIAFQNPDIRLKPNMFANVSFFTPKRTMPVVPTMSLVLKDDTDQVFVEVEPWIFEARPVEIGFQQGDVSIVESGLKAGDRIVVKGGVLLND